MLGKIMILCLTVALSGNRGDAGLTSLQDAAAKSTSPSHITLANFVQEIDAVCRRKLEFSDIQVTQAGS